MNASSDPGERVIEFPDAGPERALVVDPHTHTVFSDGHLWPRSRVAEAFRDALDAVAITDHIEWQPHLGDIPHPDRNRSHELAVDARGDTELIVIRGSEITREPAANHVNAVFLEDVNALLELSERELDPSDARAYYLAAGEWPARKAVAAANDQGAFVFWNHPWSSDEDPDGITRIPAFHSQNARRGLLHGIEITNGQTYSKGAFEVALEFEVLHALSAPKRPARARRVIQLTR